MQRLCPMLCLPKDFTHELASCLFPFPYPPRLWTLWPWLTFTSHHYRWEWLKVLSCYKGFPSIGFQKSREWDQCRSKRGRQTVTGRFYKVNSWSSNWSYRLAYMFVLYLWKTPFKNTWRWPYIYIFEQGFFVQSAWAQFPEIFSLIS